MKYEGENWCLYVGDALKVLPSIGPVSAIITDPPYSPKTHREFDHTAREAFGSDAASRSKLGYDAWTAEQVEAFVKTAAPFCVGWFVAMSDHLHATVWESAMRATGRCAFPPPWCASSRSSPQF